MANLFLEKWQLAVVFEQTGPLKQRQDHDYLFILWSCSSLSPLLHNYNCKAAIVVGDIQVPRWQPDRANAN